MNYREEIKHLEDLHEKIGKTINKMQSLDIHIDYGEDRIATDIVYLSQSVLRKSLDTLDEIFQILIDIENRQRV